MQLCLDVFSGVRGSFRTSEFLKTYISIRNSEEKELEQKSHFFKELKNKGGL